MLEASLRRSARLTNGTLLSSIEYSLLAPGKRIRPRLLLATGKLLGLKSSQCLPSAAALEMVHCFSLIHDDLPCMDDDDLRRGRPSNHKVFGEDFALLAGDALYGLACETLLTTPVSVKPARTLLAASVLLKASRGMIQGQTLELEQLKHKTKPSLKFLKEIHRLKTGQLFEASVMIPLALAGIAKSDAKHRALARLASQVGEAFQIQDDLEDPRERALRDPKNILYFEKHPRQLAAKTLSRLTHAMTAVSKRFGHREARPVLKEIVPLCSALESQTA